MPEFDDAQLTTLIEDLFEGVNLSPAEKLEVRNIAKGLTCIQSATLTNLSVATIRSRRKRIYAKLDVPGRYAILSELLSGALRRMAA